jgi:hypothetical protein
LSSSPVFSRTDTTTDSERFYFTVLDLLEDIEEQVEVNELLAWWDRYELIITFFLSATNRWNFQSNISELFISTASH